MTDSNSAMTILANAATVVGLAIVVAGILYRFIKPRFRRAFRDAIKEVVDPQFKRFKKDLKRVKEEQARLRESNRP